jgi:hypothetical protein
MEIHDDLFELAVALEHHEAEVWRRFALAASQIPDNPLGAVSDTAHIVPLTAMKSFNFASFNRVIALGVGNEPSSSDIDEIVNFYASHDQTNFEVELVPVTTPPDLGEQLLSRGFRPDPLTIVKSWRGVDHLPDRSDVPLTLLGPQHAQDWSQLHRRAREVPRMFAPWFSATFGDPLFQHMGVFDDGQLVAAGALLASDGLAWCGFSVTLQSHRGRGLQTALAIESLHVARELGCHTVHVENDPDTPESRSVSLSNVRKFGYHFLYEKTKYLSPDPGSALLSPGARSHDVTVLA